MLGVELALAYTQQSRSDDTLINIHNIKKIKDKKNQAIKVQFGVHNAQITLCADLLQNQIYYLVTISDTSLDFGKPSVQCVGTGPLT
jgi:competence transcription factor ComK